MKKEIHRQNQMAGFGPGLPEVRMVLVPCLLEFSLRLFFVHMVLWFTYSLILGGWSLTYHAGSSLLVWAFSSCNTNCERDNSSSSPTARTTGTPHIYQMETLENSSCLLPSKIKGLFWKISQIINHYSHCNMLSYFANVCPGARTRWSKRQIIFP